MPQRRLRDGMNRDCSHLTRKKEKRDRVHFAVDNLFCETGIGDKRRRAISSFVSLPAGWPFKKAHPLRATLNIHENLRLSVACYPEVPRRIRTLSDFIWQRRRTLEKRIATVATTQQL